MGFSTAFFEVTAQLIPVLFLAMVVEERLEPEDQRPGDRVMRSWVIALLVIGEVISLAVVAGGLPPSKGSGSIVASALFFVAFMIVVPVLDKELKAERSRLERLGHAAAGVAVVLTVLFTLLAIQFG